jgi:hypothetical protein
MPKALFYFVIQAASGGHSVILKIFTYSIDNPIPLLYTAFS